MRQSITTLLIGALAAFAPLVGNAARAQEAWPQKQVTIIVPFNAGGTTDMFARIFANAMQAKTGTPFVVENRGGAGGNIGAAAAARAANDGCWSERCRRTRSIPSSTRTCRTTPKRISSRSR
jgi:tripartite-type tricarboxylate transporter receptor subunit TctC